ncbi:MAG: hypothetical protein RDV48_28805 [Candidatus Eremiobacteraeota bacterium]|nr:hypothetical protein [Candidatus Eremiobacteraeota bacterium]
MTIEKAGPAFQEATVHKFPRRLTLPEGEGQKTCPPDGYTPGEKTGGGKVPENFMASLNPRVESEEGRGEERSFLRKLAFTMTLGLTGLAMLPSALSAAPAVRPVAQPAAQPVNERVIESQELPAFREQAFQMTTGEVLDELGKTAQDLRKLDDSPAPFPGADQEKVSVDELRGMGEVSIRTPQVITRSRSVSGTMSYDRTTGEPQRISAEVMTRIAGKKVTRHVEYSQDATSTTCSVSMEGVTYRVTMGRSDSLHEAFQHLSAWDLMNEVNSAAHDLRSLDDSPLQMLVKENGRMVPAGSIDRQPCEGEVNIAAPHRLGGGRSITGTFSFDGNTGRPKALHADVSEESGRLIKTRTLELSESETTRTFRASTGTLTFEVQIEKVDEF